MKSMRLNLTRPLHSLKMSRAVAKYERDGYVIFQSAISGALLADTKRHVDWLSAKYPHVRPETLIDPQMVVGDAFWLRLVSDKARLDIAEQFIGPNIALFATGYLSKPARDALRRSIAPLICRPVVSLKSSTGYNRDNKSAQH